VERSEQDDGGPTRSVIELHADMVKFVDDGGREAVGESSPHAAATADGYRRRCAERGARLALMRLEGR
jgi:hypothetical protein